MFNINKSAIFKMSDQCFSGKLCRGLIKLAIFEWSHVTDQYQLKTMLPWKRVFEVLSSPFEIKNTNLHLC